MTKFYDGIIYEPEIAELVKKISLAEITVAINNIPQNRCQDSETYMEENSETTTEWTGKIGFKTKIDCGETHKKWWTWNIRNSWTARGKIENKRSHGRGRSEYFNSAT